MSRITFFAALSIDGFAIPLKRLQSFEFDFFDFEKLACGVNVILMDLDEDVCCSKLVAKKKIYKIGKDLSLTTLDNMDCDQPMTVEQLHSNKNGDMLVLGNTNNLVGYLLDKDWVDELVICMLPILLGQGKRGFPELSTEKYWTVKGRQIYYNGVTLQFYEKGV